MPNMIKGGYSFRRSVSQYGDAFEVYPKSERSHWSVKARIYPASDRKTYVISMNNRMIDARPSLDEAIELVLSRLGG